MSRASQAENRDSSRLAATSIGVQALSEAKPLRWSFLLTFSIVLLAIWVVVSVFAHSQRSRLVDELVVVVATRHRKRSQSGTATNGAHARPAARNLCRRGRLAVAAGRPPGTRLDRRAAPQMARPGEIAPQRGTRRDPARTARRRARRRARIDLVARLSLAGAGPRKKSSGSPTPRRRKMRSTWRFTANRCSRPQPRDSSRRHDIVPVASAEIDDAPDAIFNPPSRLALESIVPDASRRKLKTSSRAIRPSQRPFRHRLPRPLRSPTATPRGRSRRRSPSTSRESPRSPTRPIPGRRSTLVAPRALARRQRHAESNRSNASSSGAASAASAPTSSASRFPTTPPAASSSCKTCSRCPASARRPG